MITKTEDIKSVTSSPQHLIQLIQLGLLIASIGWILYSMFVLGFTVLNIFNISVTIIMDVILLAYFLTRFMKYSIEVNLKRLSTATDQIEAQSTLKYLNSDNVRTAAFHFKYDIPALIEDAKSKAPYYQERFKCSFVPMKKK